MAYLILQKRLGEGSLVPVGVSTPTSLTTQSITTSTSSDFSAIANGDLAVLVLSISNNAANPATPSGWTQFISYSSGSGNGQAIRGYYRIKQSGDTTVAFSFGVTTGVLKWLTGFSSATAAVDLGTVKDTGFNSTIQQPAADIFNGEKLMRYSQWTDQQIRNVSSGFPPTDHTSQGSGGAASHWNGSNNVYVSGATALHDEQTAGTKSGYTFTLNGSAYDIRANVAIINPQTR